MKRIAATAAALALAAPLALVHAQAPNAMRVAGNFSSNTKHVDAIEKPFFIALPKLIGVPLNVNYNPMDVVNVQAADALRLLRSGTFDVMSVQIGMASRDDPFFEGIDLIGVSTNMKDLRKAVDAYRAVFDQRLQARFNAKVLTLWPFGPQVFYCNKPIKTVNDIKGLKVRSFTPSMAALIQYLGGTPITLQFSEVYTVAAARRRRLRRDLADVRQHRQVAGGHHALPAALGVGLGPGPLHEPQLLEEVLARAAAEDHGRLQADGGPDVGPRRARQRRRGQLQRRQGAVQGGREVQDAARRRHARGREPDQVGRHRGGAAAVEADVQQGRPQVHRDLERDGRQGARATRSTEAAAATGARMDNPISRIVEPVARWAAILCGWGVLVLSVAITIEILGRKLFAFSFHGIDDIGGYVLAITATVGASYTMAMRGHTRVDVFLVRMPPGLQRFLNALAMVTMAVFAVFAAWRGSGRAAGVDRVPERRDQPAPDAAVAAAGPVARRDLPLRCDRGRLRGPRGDPLCAAAPPSSTGTTAR